jgi:hypothetical protein
VVKAHPGPPPVRRRRCWSTSSSTSSAYYVNDVYSLISVIWRSGVCDAFLEFPTGNIYYYVYRDRIVNNKNFNFLYVFSFTSLDFVLGCLLRTKHPSDRLLIVHDDTP